MASTFLTNDLDPAEREARDYEVNEMDRAEQEAREADRKFRDELYQEFLAQQKIELETIISTLRD